ncbi:DUF393 domain-containing protein [Alkalimarinus alittae]|uniref:DUF393 domain-containing protein n=1 Tax=Alkalimarinus alittae TaxID=2961619 RepID=A0ABY6N1P9_9ALTE|nr:DUF393 domain-containing protein [Alkalimarinus alittae]UZE96001.1 DUF393 domain-containing protein [Alkalimarinus alittae]
MKANKNPKSKQDKIRVYYDAACPVCRKDRKIYDALAGKDAVEWCDITGNDQQLIAQGIAPKEALIKLHVQNGEGVITNDIEAYVLLFSNIWWLKPLAWLLNIHWVKEISRSLYRKWVLRRLTKDGRLKP